MNNAKFDRIFQKKNIYFKLNNLPKNIAGS